jgi:hypothetical protein
MALSSKFKRILFVSKTTRLTRYHLSGQLMNPYVEKVYKSKMEESHKTHNSVVTSFTDVAAQMSKRVLCKLDTEIT